MITKTKALLSLCPNAQWVLRGDDLEWISKDQTQPTEADIEAEIKRLQDLAPKLERIAELQKLLADTDYVALADYDQNKPEIKAQRQAWRDEIRQLQGAA
jgi:RAB protein geranylgeranyltransferase component A